jgi:flavodoxin/NAD-dependent dihydropyrimidine dehydrogenase PreA subunit
MELSIIYFSQTGNTLKVARAIGDVFQKENHHVRIISMERAGSDDAISGDLLAIGTPCFSSRVPQPVMQFLDSLPEMKNHKAFVFATSGGAPGKVLNQMADSLHEKCFDVLAGHLTRGEVHHPAPSLIGRFPDRPNIKDLQQAQNFARAICEHLRNPSTTLPGSNLFSKKNKIGFYEFLGSVITDQLVRVFLPEPKLHAANCDQCGFCVQACPMHNIHMEPYPVFGRDCLRCYHCYNICPGGAFVLQWHYSDLILRLLYNPLFERWFGDLKPGESIYERGYQNPA